MAAASNELIADLTRWERRHTLEPKGNGMCRSCMRLQSSFAFIFCIFLLHLSFFHLYFVFFLYLSAFAFCILTVTFSPHIPTRIHTHIHTLTLVQSHSHICKIALTHSLTHSLTFTLALTISINHSHSRICPIIFVLANSPSHTHAY